MRSGAWLRSSRPFFGVEGPPAIKILRKANSHGWATQRCWEGKQVNMGGKHECLPGRQVNMGLKHQSSPGKQVCVGGQHNDTCTVPVTPRGEGDDRTFGV